MRLRTHGWITGYCLGWLLAGIVLTLGNTGCGPSYTADDTTANTIADRYEAAQYQRCLADDAGTCAPSFVRSSAALAFCANAKELQRHGAPVPEGGPPCP
jgi:hypothetical protein